MYTKNICNRIMILTIIVCLPVFIVALLASAAARAAAPPTPTSVLLTIQADNPDPPASPVKLVFIHHSTGGNWLADPNVDQPYGGLGIALRDNNYFVSATNYDWGPDAIGSNTDLGYWWDWFRGGSSATYLAALYNESGQTLYSPGDWRYFGAWSRLATNPGGQNKIVMFKSCFPNSNLAGNPTDPPTTGDNPLRGQDAWSEHMTVANAKGIYNDILAYFATRPDKLFVVITAPPLSAGNTTPARAANARAFNTWLVQNWLTEAGYTGNNVAVFDYYNVLTHPDNHHRYHGGVIEYVTTNGDNTLYYPGPDGEHPSTTGQQKATTEFVSLLNIFYNRWNSGSPTVPSLTLTAPHGGERWQVNTQQQIRWITTGLVEQVNLSYSTDGFATAHEIAGPIANTDLYIWTTPVTPTTTARVRVESVVSPTTVYAVSHTDFTLCTPGNCYYSSYLPLILKNQNSSTP